MDVRSIVKAKFHSWFCKVIFDQEMKKGVSLWRGKIDWEGNKRLSCDKKKVPRMESRSNVPLKERNLLNWV